jgi:hypothetical protein
MSKDGVVLSTLKSARIQCDVRGLLHDIKTQLSDLIDGIDNAIKANDQRKDLTKSIDKEYENS